MRAEAKPDAGTAVILGSSTSRDWITFKALVRHFGEGEANVLDAHVNGCHQGCTWAQVRRLLAEGRHFRVAIFGVNQFQFCDDRHSKRVLHHRMLMPGRDAPVLLGHYLRSEDPLRKLGQFVFGALSTAYADTRSVRAKLRRVAPGRARPKKAHRWAKRRASTAAARTVCSYDDERVALKLGFTRDLLDDLALLADDVYFLMLPDRTLASEDSDVLAAWGRHRQILQELASARPSVTLVDLTARGPWPADKFKDEVHLKRSAFGPQFRDLLRALEPSRKAAAP